MLSKKAPLPVFFLVSLGLVLCYFWVARPASAIAQWPVWQEMIGKQASAQLSLAELKAQVSESADSSATRFAGVWQKDWQVRAALEGQSVTELNLIPTHKVSAATMQATLGEPKLRLELDQGTAWLYPAQGVTLYFQQDALRLLEALPVKARP